MWPSLSALVLLVWLGCSAALRAPPISARAVASECDVVVIGSGIGGLSSAAVLSSTYRQHVQVFESHYRIGGCAHSFPIKSKTSGVTYNFDAGPTITLGCSAPPFNPLMQVLNAVGGGSLLDWIRYDRWGVVNEDGAFPFVLGEGQFESGALLRFGGPAAVLEFKTLRAACAPLCAGAAAIPSMALRDGRFRLLPLLPHAQALQQVVPYADVLSGSFRPFMNKYVRSPWLRAWLDALAFSLSGLPAAETGAATMAYTLFDLHRKDAALDYPRGGFGAIAEALATVAEQTGSSVHVRSPVADVLVERGRAVGVRLGDGRVVRARRGVVCNTDIWTLPSLLRASADQLTAAQRQQLLDAPAAGVKMTQSFLHLHLGLDASGLDLSKMLPHYTVFDRGLGAGSAEAAEAAAAAAAAGAGGASLSGVGAGGLACANRNMVAVSNPCVLDAQGVGLVQGEGRRLGGGRRLVVHAYGAGNERYEDWRQWAGGGEGEEEDQGQGQGQGRASAGEEGGSGSGSSGGSGSSVGPASREAYEAAKRESSAFLYRSVGRALGLSQEELHARTDVSLVGTPLTHRRFLRRTRGTYGAEFGSMAPSSSSGLAGLVLAGDSVFPGIGIPAVCLSGAVAANSLVSVGRHLVSLGRGGKATQLQTTKEESKESE